MNWIIAGCHCCQGESFHLFGGSTASGDVSDNDRYSPSASAWTSLTNLVSPARSDCRGFTVQNVAYVVGGDPLLYDNDSYVLDTWTSKTDCTYASSELIAGSVGLYGYAVFFDGENREYDPSGNSWATKATRTPYATRNRPSSFSIDGGFFTATGLSTGTNKETVKYDPSTDSWSSKADHPVAKQQASGMSIGGKGYVFGGLSTEYNQLDEYEPTGDSWAAKANNSSGTANGMSCGFKSEGFACSGGVTVPPLVYSNHNDSYTPATDTWTGAIVVPTPLRRLSACTNLK